MLNRGSGLSVNRNVVAVCEHITYDVLDEGDGYEVNDAHSQGMIEIPGVVTLFNATDLPKENSSSIKNEMMFLSYSLSDRAIKQELGIKGKIEIDGDDITYYISRERDGYPLGELRIVEWKDAD